MLVEVKHFTLLTEAQLRRLARAAAARLEEAEWRDATMAIEHFPNCPGCGAPPQPQRQGYNATASIPHRSHTLGYTGESVFERLGPEEKTWEFTCICGTELEYRGYGPDGVELIKATTDYNGLTITHTR